MARRKTDFTDGNLLVRDTDMGGKKYLGNLGNVGKPFEIRGFMSWHIWAGKRHIWAIWAGVTREA
jgi:hypothetical protein